MGGGGRILGDWGGSVLEELRGEGGREAVGPRSDGG